MTWLRGLAGLAVLLAVAIGVVFWMGHRLPLEHTARASGSVFSSSSSVGAKFASTGRASVAGAFRGSAKRSSMASGVVTGDRAGAAVGAGEAHGLLK